MSKPKRKLSDISFEGENAHIALVSKEQGGPANNQPHQLILKSTVPIDKVQDVVVTMDLKDFLSRFMWMMEDDAEFIASMLGWVEVEDDAEENSPANYLSKRIGASEVVMKGLHKASDFTKSLLELTDEQRKELKDAQALLEPVIKKALAAKAQVKKAASKPKKKEVKMEDETVTIEKAQHAEIVKQLAEQAELIKAFQAEKVELTKAAKLAVVKSALKDEKQAEVVFKALSYEDEAAFAAAVEVLKSLQAQVDAGAQFQEIGTSTQDPEVKPAESLVAKALKAKFQPAK
jgi:hypothetical protein